MRNLSNLLGLAHQAMDLAVERFRPPAHVSAKDERDLVTDIDLDVERTVRAHMARATPELGFLGEEGGHTGPTSAFWVLDPVDGTANFARGLPVCGISLALVRGSAPVVGVIALPLLGRRYWAAAGHGAHRDGESIRASQRTRLAEAMVALGDYGTGQGAQERNLIAFALDQELAARVERLRRLGSAAADLALVADGTLDASLTLGNHPWDMAAGALIARESGAVVADSDGSDHTTASVCTLAMAPGLSEELLGLVAAAVRGTAYAPSLPR
ncbi:inositol monophosphatase family protein [Nocardiopsis metallicus]|uniref:inositol-phosphate phosphatase n=1 Tax=Nocardiopsis metallicus TaxID=179819 RepID=A0A840WT53_9ACTN|nr:inositol monophosphatase family protein [Nocardiopsis metallicus]MBB5494786.1 myo-inositol-1(or 4)-monophosphatase [Nocardiopsis metallicus]